LTGPNFGEHLTGTVNSFVENAALWLAIQIAALYVGIVSFHTPRRFLTLLRRRCPVQSDKSWSRGNNPMADLSRSWIDAYKKALEEADVEKLHQRVLEAEKLSLTDGENFLFYRTVIRNHWHLSVPVRSY
jgi:hypothetical protein